MHISTFPYRKDKAWVSSSAGYLFDFRELETQWDLQSIQVPSRPIGFSEILTRTWEELTLMVWGKYSYHKFIFIRFYGNIFCSIYPFIINKKTEVKFLARQLGLDSAGTFIPYPNHIFKDAFVLQTSAREIRKCLVAKLLQQGYRYHKL